MQFANHDLNCVMRFGKVMKGLFEVSLLELECRGSVVLAVKLLRNIRKIVVPEENVYRGFA